MKIPPYEIRWMLLNIIEDEKDNIEDFKQKYEVLKPYMNIDLFMAEQKKTEEKTIVSDHFDDVLLQHSYDNINSIKNEEKMIEEKERKIKEIIGEKL